ncbi:hypothetical protein [Paraburkholderia solisilvae]|uniref:hypothetical protein n=1 Tax=Paraburkholderia solisilvae TaxID=624376 RepID=UPI0015833A8E|nr:hypothetical protein [Paraburkholderia solisilvae]
MDATHCSATPLLLLVTLPLLLPLLLPPSRLARGGGVLRKIVMLINIDRPVVI